MPIFSPTHSLRFRLGKNLDNPARNSTVEIAFKTNMSGTYPPFYTFTDDNYGGVVIIVTYAFLCCSLSVVAARMWNIGHNKQLQINDATMAMANVCSL